MKNRRIILVAHQNWELEIGSNAKNLALEFARHNAVLYVNPTLDVKTILTERKNPQVQQRLKNVWHTSIQQVTPTLWVCTLGIVTLSINWIQSKTIFRWLNRFNNWLFARSIRKAADRLGFADFVLFNDSQMFLGLHQKQMLRPEKYIYYVRDYLITQPYFKKHGTWAEAELMASADGVVANSAYLADYAHQSNPNSHDVGQGCELNYFDPAVNRSKPVELITLPRPLIGYTGFLTSARLDVALLEQLALAKPHWSFVLVGPEDDVFKASRLHSLPNIHFTGSRPSEQLPAYVQHFDVCINPQVVNELTIGNYPRKIDEYLGMGKPVVASQTRAMEMFQAHVYLADSPDAYVSLLEKALAEDSDAKATARIRFARSHTWEASAQAIYQVMFPISQPKESVYES